MHRAGQGSDGPDQGGAEVRSSGDDHPGGEGRGVEAVVHGQDQVAGSGHSLQVLDHFIEPLQEDYFLPVSFQGLDDQVCSDPCNRLLPGRIDVGDDHQVRFLKRVPELLPQKFRSGIAVGLKYGDRPAAPEALAGHQQRPDLSGVVRIIIDYLDAVELGD